MLLCAEQRGYDPKDSLNDSMRPYSLLDVAPTAARVLGISLPRSDGRSIGEVESWGCRNVVLIIVDSLGYDLYKWLESSLVNMPALANEGLLLRAEAVSNHTTSSIATILSGLLPEHHGIQDKQGAKQSSLLSIPEIASSCGLPSAVIMEKNGAEVYLGLIEIASGIPDTLLAEDFDREACRLTLQAQTRKPRLLVSYFIGIDKAVHLGKGPREIREAALIIDDCTGRIIRAANGKTLFILCGDHPVHAGKLKRTRAPYCVALIMGKK